MPVRRLVLPREVAGVNAVEVSGPEVTSSPEGSGDPDDVVVLVVPSPVLLLQAGWLDALRRRSWSRFADWLQGALADPEGGWRYDRLVERWVGSVGPERVHVVAGDGPEPVEAALGGLTGAVPVAVAGWTRSLTGPEVAAVEALVEELEELGLDGRNAADMLDGAVAAMVRTPASPGARPAADAVPEELARRFAAEADRMLAAVETAGVALHGDVSALRWSEPSRTVSRQVGLAAAVAMSVGALERVATWAEAR